MATVQDAFNPFKDCRAEGLSPTQVDSALSAIAAKFPAHSDTMRILKDSLTHLVPDAKTGEIVTRTTGQVGTRFKHCETVRLIADLKPWKPSAEQPTIVHALARKLGAGNPGMLSVFAALSDTVRELDGIKPANHTQAGDKAVTEVQQALMHTGQALNCISTMGFATPGFFKEFRSKYHEVREGLELQEHPCARELALATAAADTMRCLRKIPQAEADRASLERRTIARSGQDATMDAYNAASDTFKAHQQRLALYDTALKQVDGAVAMVAANAGKFVRHQDKPMVEIDTRVTLDDVLPAVANKKVHGPKVAA